MLGQPKYKCGQKVKLIIKTQMESEYIVGIIGIVDSYGSLEVLDEPSYDIWGLADSGELCLYKHVAERDVLPLDKEGIVCHKEFNFIENELGSQRRKML
jgi:hypothetical protein